MNGGLSTDRGLSTILSSFVNRSYEHKMGLDILESNLLEINAARDGKLVSDISGTYLFAAKAG
jgi:hypothetical protein